MHDSVWVLPANPRSQEQFQWLAAEIVELGGEATLCHSEIASEAQRRALVKQFSDRADDHYKQILTELRRKRADLALLGASTSKSRHWTTFNPSSATKCACTVVARRQIAVKWVTWENIGVDRMACAWLIRRFIDPKAKFLFIPRDAPLPGNAEPFDIPGVRLSHHGGHCSFHAFVREYKLDDPVLAKIARIVDEADTVQEVNVEPAAPGLDMICSGIRLASADDLAALEKGGFGL